MDEEEKNWWKNAKVQEWKVTEEDYRRILELLKKPPNPTPRLIAALRGERKRSHG